MLHVPLDKKLISERVSALEQLQSTLKPLLEKIRKKYKKETFWATRRHGKYIPRAYFVQELTLAYYRRDDGDKHCSEVTTITNVVQNITNVTKPFARIEECAVRKLTENLENNEYERTANLSPSVDTTPETDPNSK